ncbi:MAG: hypothetical protein ACR2G4_01785 [Pyrinomonadaceae bacterium]
MFDARDNVQSRWVKLGALACALAVAAVLLISYRLLRVRQLERARAIQETEQVAKTVPVIEAQIFEDEARLQGSQALVSGTIRNISEKKLEALSLEMELKRRTVQATERRKIKVNPTDLLPGEVGRYSLSLPSSEWSGARVLSVISGQRQETIGFKSAVGERRPLERPSQINQKVIVTPRPRPKGEEFINTPDNPTRIP